MSAKTSCRIEKLVEGSLPIVIMVATLLLTCILYVNLDKNELIRRIGIVAYYAEAALTFIFSTYYVVKEVRHKAYSSN